MTVAKPVRLNKAELAEWRQIFQCEQTPRELLRSVDDFMDLIGTAFFTQAGLSFAREAWVIGQYGVIANAKSVRLSECDNHDCEMDTGQGSLRFEITEADQPGRRRGDEYKQAETQTVTPDPIEEVRRRAKNAEAMVAKAVRAKLAKNYPQDVGLIVYLNLMEYGWFEDEVEKAMYNAVQQALSHFPTVEILWQDRVYRFTSAGAPPQVLKRPS